MKTKNELILDKLIEIGKVTVNSFGDILYKDGFVTTSRHFNVLSIIESSIIFDALVSECGKRDFLITICGNQMVADHLGGDEIYGDTYTRSAVAEAFIKVTGISEVSE